MFSGVSMTEIFSYYNFRDFLRDYYKNKKTENPAISYAYLAQKAGFKSKSFIPHVIEGKKNLSQESIYKLGTALKLDKKSFAYFEAMVSFNQAKTLEQRNYFFTRLCSLGKTNSAKIVQKKQYEFYSEWYHNTIREIVSFVDFKDDYNYLAKMVKPAITPKQARNSVKLLLSLGMIEKNQDGYKQVDRSITTGDEVASLAVQNFHVKNLLLAADIISVCPPEERDLSALVVGLSEKGFQSIREEIRNFRKKLVDIVDKDTAAERVYHINFQFLPTSERKSDASV
jgi:uncharacterized protein (TIGR02147 family)